MKKIYPIQTFFIFLFLVSCSPKKTNEFTLTGKIGGLDTGKIILSYVPDKKPVLDTVEITNGKFLFRGQIKEPHLSALFLDWKTNRAMIFIEPGSMKISLIKDNFEGFKMSGSKSQDEFSFLNNLLKPFEDNSNSLYSEWRSLSDSLKNSDDENKKADLTMQMNNLRNLMTSEGEKIDSIQLKYINDNPKSYVSAFYLASLTVGNEKISLDSLKSLFGKIDSAIQKGRNGNQISSDIRKRENTKIGALAPDFKATDLNNRILPLSQFKKKNVVLLDFWASWCVPCRENIPHLKKIYKKYNPDGLEIIAISIDNDKNSWVKAVEDEGTNIWLNIHSGFTAYKPGDFETTSVYANYYYNTIPTQILVDLNGKIIGHWVGNSSENNSALDKQLDEILKNK